MDGMSREEAILVLISVARGKAGDLEAQYDDNHDYGIYTIMKDIEDAIDVLEVRTGKVITT